MSASCRSSWARVASFACVLVMVCAVLAPASARAQEEAAIRLQSVDAEEHPLVTLTLVLPAEQFPPGGGIPEFEVRENDTKVSVSEVIALAAVRPAIDVVLVMDLSRSMDGQPLLDAKEAARDFTALLGPDDNIAVVAFSDRARLVSGFSSTRSQTAQTIRGLEVEDRTALYDAIVEAARIAPSRGGAESSIVVLSDGDDSASTHSLGDAVVAATDAGVPVYAVALESPGFRPEALRTISDATGGRTFSVADSSELGEQFEAVAEELRNTYDVSFESREPRTVELELDVVATLEERTASLETAIENPLFETVLSVAGAAEEYREGVQSDPLVLAGTLILFFAAITLLVVATGLLLARTRTGLEDLEFYDQMQTRPSEAQAVGAPGDSLRGRMIELIGWVAGRRGFTQALNQKLEQAGLPLRPLEYMYVHLIAVLGVGFLAQILTGDTMAGILLVFITVFGPLMALEVAIDRRRRAFEEQLPDILALIAGSIRVGWGLLQSLDLVVKETSEPASVEFRRVEAEARLGLPLDQALEKMAERLDSSDFRWVVVAINIQREVGGNLAEVLDILAETMRARAELRRHISALTAEGRMSAVILSALPFVAVIALYLLNPDYLGDMFTHPFGIAMLLWGIVLMIIGGIWLWRAIKVEI